MLANRIGPAVLQPRSLNSKELDMRKIVLLAALGAALFTAGCNTFAGAGRDVSSAGHAVTDTANDAKPH
jgi:predicted small secreted protein